MAIFNNSTNTGSSAASSATSGNANTTIITEGSFIKGEMNLACDLYVDGEFEGVISSEKEVTVGANGHIKGEIRTNHLIVQGLIEGSIDATRVEIRAAGRVNGSITSSELVIEAHGIFEGDSKIKHEEKVRINLGEVKEKLATAKKREAEVS